MGIRVENIDSLQTYNLICLSYLKSIVFQSAIILGWLQSRSSVKLQTEPIGILDKAWGKVEGGGGMLTSGATRYS